MNYAKEKGLDVYHAGIEEFEIVGERRFDVVLLLNVLEHLREPAKTLVDIKEKLLTKDGILVIDVPNEYNDFQLVANSEYQLGDWWVCPPNHINYFSASSLESVLNKCGYSVKHKEGSFPMELFLNFGDVYVGDGDLGKQCHGKG